MSHGHSHNHGGCEHEASSVDPLEMGIQYSLFEKIDFLNMECLNESEEDSGRNVFKPYKQRLDFEKVINQKYGLEIEFNV